MVKLKKILIVEDNPINQQILNKILSGDFTIIKAENGQIALNFLKQSWEDISLIILDLIMPVMDGHTFLSIVKNDPYYSSIPIIVTTSNDSEHDEIKALSRGATDFIRKPYHWPIVKHRVMSIISLRETAAMFNLIKYDQLTNLYSKEYFYKIASEKITMNPDKYYDIICCDIENFSLVNDTLGYERGNEVLKTAAGVLLETIPDIIVSSRLNSDIFAFLVPHHDIYDPEYFNKATEAFNTKVKFGNLILDFGIYHITDPGLSVYKACNRALSVIDKIKNQFTVNFAFYDNEFHKDKLFTQRIAANMESSLKNHEFIVYYQPKYSLITNEMIGAEALVRWISPSEGFMSPGKFIPLFESNGFITELDKYVWEEVCKFLRQSIDNGTPFLPISVNVSRTDLYSIDVADIFVKLIRKYDLKPEYLHLEITESAYNEHPEIILEITNKLHDLGFILEMDDFGNGYSSLNMLSEMTLDILKLDMRFVRKLALDLKHQAVLSAIVNLAKQIDLVIIAEGIETEEQSTYLRDLGCDQAQGYYYSKPIPQEDYKKLLQNISKE